MYNELTARGTPDFSISFYHVDENHARYNMDLHWHAEIELIQVLEGSLKVRLDNCIYDLKKGDVLFVNSETVHGAVPQSCIYECIVCHTHFLYTETESCRSYIEGVSSRAYVIHAFHAANTAFATAVHDIFSAMRQDAPGSKFYVLSAFYKLFGIILNDRLFLAAADDATRPEDKNIPKLKKVLSFIAARYDTQISLSDMADAAGMSRKYFCFFFKKMTGKTPVAYLNTYRAEKAAQKLRHTDQSVTDIAYACGFNDLSYFIKTFKRIKGVSPNAFRKARIL